jgi:hypothetical protein
MMCIANRHHRIISVFIPDRCAATRLRGLISSIPCDFTSAIHGLTFHNSRFERALPKSAKRHE